MKSIGSTGSPSRCLQTPSRRRIKERGKIASECGSTSRRCCRAIGIRLVRLHGEQPSWPSLVLCLAYGSQGSMRHTTSHMHDDLHSTVRPRISCHFTLYPRFKFVSHARETTMPIHILVYLMIRKPSNSQTPLPPSALIFHV